MKLWNKALFCVLAVFLFTLFFGGICSDKDSWTDHLMDPALDEKKDGNGGGDEWVGTWLFVGWSATDEDGNVVEGPEEFEPGDEGGFTLNADGTYSFEGMDESASGDYTVADGVLTLDGMDEEWWGQPWNMTVDGNEMSIGVGEWPDGEGEGYILAKGQADPLIASWLLIAWWATDGAGETVEGPEENEPGDEGGIILNADGTYVFSLYGESWEGSYTSEGGVLVMDGIDDEWWAQEWTISYDEDGNLMMGTDDWPDGAGEGYLFEKGEGGGGEEPEEPAYLGSWLIVKFHMEDADGNIIEEEEADWVEQFWLNEDGTMSFDAEGEVFDGTFEIDEDEEMIFFTLDHDHWGSEDGFRYELDDESDPPTMALSLEEDGEIMFWTFEMQEEE